ncbi:uncharacterized protein LOC117317709 isoform X2 [Pecten maximus]|uniref:uncharacterized protein LOC117317709 isoform X2 n=1 Tax=Pecten maximus TaxID=6579 RepID=UPI001458C513|nr:uncharacterized protein LOC117317709 isoform X2 [Pecten maximus]
MIRFIVFLLCVTIIIPIVVPRAVEPAWYGKCVKYCKPKDKPPQVVGYQRGCISDHNCTYCKFFACPEFSVCGNGEVPEPTRDKICMACPGECLYLGETYAQGESGIMSVDTVNECVCRGFIPQIVCQKIEPQPSPDVFCEY